MKREPMIKVYYNSKGKNTAKKIVRLLLEAESHVTVIPEYDWQPSVSVYFGTTPIATRYEKRWVLLREKIIDPVAKAAVQKTLEILAPIVGKMRKEK